MRRVDVVSISNTAVVENSLRVAAKSGVECAKSVGGVQEVLRPMLFMCGYPAYRGRPMTFVYAVLDTSDQQQSLQHNVRFGVGGQLQRLTEIRRQLTPEWLTASDITAAECVSSNGSLAELRRQHERPIVGNFVRHTFDIADTYEVRFFNHLTPNDII